MRFFYDAHVSAFLLKASQVTFTTFERVPGHLLAVAVMSMGIESKGIELKGRSTVWGNRNHDVEA